MPDVANYFHLITTGAGVPFFWTKFDGIVKTDENKARTGQIAKQVRIYWWFPCVIHSYVYILKAWRTSLTVCSFRSIHIRAFQSTRQWEHTANTSYHSMLPGHSATTFVDRPCSRE
jgi:hypothetical protein